MQEDFDALKIAVEHLIDQISWQSDKLGEHTEILEDANTVTLGQAEQLEQIETRLTEHREMLQLLMRTMPKLFSNVLTILQALKPVDTSQLTLPELSDKVV